MVTIETTGEAVPDRAPPRMARELFGVFGDETQFARHRSESEFDRVVAGESITVGIRDVGLGIPGRSSVHETDDGCCVIWGETVSGSDARPTAAWLFDRFAARGRDAFEDLNGSYLAIVDYGGEALVVPDLLRSWECFYADLDDCRVFGTDAARITRRIDEPVLDRRGLNELIHFGVVFENRTLIDQLWRQPFDGYLTADTTGDLGRFVYRSDGERADYAADLADRLRRAVDRRSRYPGDRGILASAGFDSRLLLATLSDLDTCYTLGTPTTPEVGVARRIADQYDVDHELLPVSESYLDPSPEIVQYTNGVRESIHIHHRGNVDQLTASTMYHGLLLDTILRDHYLPRLTIDLFDHPLPLPTLESNPDPIAFFVDRLGVYDESDEPLVDCVGPGTETTAAFIESTIRDAIGGLPDRTDSIHNAMARLGVTLTPALPFRTHLADNHLESLIAADADLVEWHLTTPPAHRNGRTYQRALERIDDDILEHRPPDRPHASHTLNEIEGFVRRNVPWLASPGTPWPDRDYLYEASRMDERLFPDAPAVHRLPARVKLRINDALVWLESATGRRYDAEELLRLD